MTPHPRAMTSAVWFDERFEKPSIDELVAAGSAFKDTIPVVTERRGTGFYGFYARPGSEKRDPKQALRQSAAVKPLIGLGLPPAGR